MSTPTPWPPSPPPPGGQPYGTPQGYGPTQPYGQPVTQPLPYAQPQPGPQPGQIGPYGGPPPLPYAATPKPEKPLMPAVWWALVINLVATALLGLFLLLVGWFLVELVTGFSSEETSWNEALGEDAAGTAVLAVALILVGSLLVSWLLTVASLALWRLIRGFRTIPTFVQALVAYLTMWVVTTVVSFVLQLVLGGFGALSGATTTY